MVTGGLFASLDFIIGPIDGHDLDVLASILKNSRHNGQWTNSSKTQKGYEYAEKSDDKYHGVSKFNRSNRYSRKV